MTDSTVEGGLDDPERLEPAQGTLALASPRDAQATQADWEAAAAAVLRKARRMSEEDPDSLVRQKLARRTLDGIAVTPLGTPALVADLPEPVRPPARGDGWDVRVLLCESEARRANTAAMNDLENGATSLLLRVGDSGVAGKDLATVLDGVLVDLAPVVLDAPGDQLAVAKAFAEVARGSELAAGTNLGIDPLGSWLCRTADPAELDPATIRAAVVEGTRLADELGCRALVVDGTVVHDLGASDVQELGYVLAVGAHYLRELVGAGWDVASAAERMEFRLAATDEQFPTIAKLRAVRRLWARMLEISDVPADRRNLSLHAVTSRPMMTKYDPWVNMLRTCVAAFAAGVGGADAVTVLPFDTRLGLPDAFSRRVARNTSALLVEEAHVAKVADPAGGAFAVEKLTDDLAVAAWQELGRVEAAVTELSEGHQASAVVAALRDGSLRDRIDKVVAERERQVATRQQPITGLTEFPNLQEVLPERAAYDAESSRPLRPYGEAFEALRDAPPSAQVFLATMGTVATHTARASFATNLLAAGGIEVVNEGRHDDVESVLADYDGQRVVCLAGSDPAYAEWGAALTTALREAAAEWVVVAGEPGDLGVDDSCATGVDALEFLNRTRAKLEGGSG